MSEKKIAKYLYFIYEEVRTTPERNALRTTLADMSRQAFLLKTHEQFPHIELYGARNIEKFLEVISRKASIIGDFAKGAGLSATAVYTMGQRAKDNGWCTISDGKPRKFKITPAGRKELRAIQKERKAVLAELGKVLGKKSK